MLEKIKKFERPRLSVFFLCLSFFSIFFNPGEYHSLLYTLPFYGLFCIIEYINYFKENKKIKKMHIGIKEILLLFFMAVTIFSSIFIESGFTAIKITIYYIGAVISTIVILNSSLEKKDIKFIINSYIASVILIVITMLCQQVTRSGDAFRYSIASFTNGVIKDANFLAAYMSMPVIILAIKTIFGNKNKILNAILCIICFAGVFATGSRSALIFLILSFVVLFMYYLYINRNKGIIKKLVILGIVLVIISIIAFQFIPDVFIDRYFRNSYRDGSNIARFDAWQAGITIFLKHPILGQGAESQYRLGIYNGIPYRMYTHSTYVDLVADYGLLGIFSLGILLIGMGIKCCKPNRWILLALLLNTFGTSAIISSLYVAYFWQNIIIILLLLQYEKYNRNNMYDILNINNIKRDALEDVIFKNEKKVSIILPVYNSEKTIKDTILSVIKQTYKNIELIIVDDGSTDGTEKICKKIQEENKETIKYIKIKNSGVSEARNVALKLVTGEYVTFIDSDDKYEKDYISIMLNDMIKNEVDIITCGYKTFENLRNVFTLEDDKIYAESNDKYIADLQEKQLFNQIWHKLYKFDIIKENDIKFDNKYDLGEDYIFNLDYMRYVKKAMYINDILYLYRMKDDGLNFKYRKDKFEIEYKLLKKLEQYFLENKYDMQPVYNQYVKTYFNGILFILDKKNKIGLKNKKTQIAEFISSSNYKKDLNNIKKEIKQKKYLVSIDALLKGEKEIYLIVVIYKLNKFIKDF